MEFELKDIIAYVQENKIAPSRIFSDEMLLETEAVKDAIAQRKGNENQQNEIVRLRAERETYKEKQENLKREYEEKMAELTAGLTEYQVNEKYQEEIAKRDKLTPQQLEFLKKQRTGLKVDPANDIAKQINAHLDAGIDTYNELQPLFNPGDKQESQDKKENQFEPVAASIGKDDFAEMAEYLPE
jgi:seryl-tRNA synthetase